MLGNRWNLSKAMLMYKVVYNFVAMYLSSQFLGKDTVREYTIKGNHVNLYKTLIKRLSLLSGYGYLLTVSITVLPLFLFLLSNC